MKFDQKKQHNYQQNLPVFKAVLFLSTATTTKQNLLLVPFL